MILYNISFINKTGLRTMLGPNQGRYFKKTRQEAQDLLDALASTEGGANMRRLVEICGPQSRGTFRVDPFDCYEHGDAKRIYVEELMKYYAIDGAQIEILHDLAKRLFTENRMNGDEMRVSAQIIESVLNVAKQLEVLSSVQPSGKPMGDERVVKLVDSLKHGLKNARGQVGIALNDKLDELIKQFKLDGDPHAFATMPEDDR